MKRPVVITWRHGAKFDAISWAMFVALGVGLITITGRPAAAFCALFMGLLIGIGLGTSQPCSCGHRPSQPFSPEAKCDAHPGLIAEATDTTYRVEWLTCACGKERQVRHRDNSVVLVDAYMRVAGHFACRSCEADMSIELDSCPESVDIDTPTSQGIAACRLGFRHTGRCEPWADSVADFLTKRADEAQAGRTEPQPYDGKDQG